MTAVDVAELSFPLVPRWRPVGSAFGRLRAARRGIGSSVATTRSYVPGDDPGMIDWKLSARLSSIRGTAEFIVREDFADEAPRAVVVADRAPSMGLYPDDLPWLSKPAALRAVWQAVGGGVGAGARPRGLPRHRRRATAGSPATESAVRRDRRARTRGGVRRPARPGSRRPSSTWAAAAVRCRRHLRVRLLRLPRPAEHGRRGCAPSACAGTPSPWSCRTRSGSRASRSVDGLVVPFADPVTGRLLDRCESRPGRPPAARAAREPSRSAPRRSSAASGSITSSSETPTRTVSPCVHRLGRGADREPAGCVAMSGPAPGRSTRLRWPPASSCLAWRWAGGRAPAHEPARRGCSRQRDALDPRGLVRRPARRAARPAARPRRRSTSAASGCGRASAPDRVVGRDAERTRGAGELLSYRYGLECLRQGCLPQGAASPAVPAGASSPSARATAGLGSTADQVARVSAAPRWLTRPSSGHAGAALRFDASLPAASATGSRRTRCRALLAALAALLALAAAVLALARAAPGRGTDGARRLSPLERALAAVRASTANGRPSRSAGRRSAGSAASSARSRGGEPRTRRGATRLVESRADAASPPAPSPTTSRARTERMRAAIPLAAPGAIVRAARGGRWSSRVALAVALAADAGPRVPAHARRPQRRAAFPSGPQPDDRPRPLLERVLPQRRAWSERTLRDLRRVGPQARPRPLLRHGLRGAAARARARMRCEPFLRIFTDKRDLNPWRATFSAGTRIGAALDRARLMLPRGAHRQRLGRPDQRPGRLARPTRSTSLGALVTYQREGIPIRMIGINPVPEDVRYFRDALGSGGGSVTTLADKATEIRRQAERRFPVGLVVARRADRAAARAQRAGARPADLGEEGTDAAPAILLGGGGRLRRARRSCSRCSPATSDAGRRDRAPVTSPQRPGPEGTGQVDETLPFTPGAAARDRRRPRVPARGRALPPRATRATREVARASGAAAQRLAAEAALAHVIRGDRPSPSARPPPRTCSGSWRSSTRPHRAPAEQLRRPQVDLRAPARDPGSTRQRAGEGEPRAALPADTSKSSASAACERLQRSAHAGASASAAGHGY